MSVGDPLVIDLGYGASAVTAVELATRLARTVAGVRVLGLEIDPQRVAAALPFADPPRLDFAIGGFELAGRRPQLIRAMNVLRQYPAEQVPQLWRLLCERLAAGGVLVEGTSNEVGRIASWVLLDSGGPRSLTLSCATKYLESPRTLAQRLPKALIHQNLPGRPIHDLLSALSDAWATHAALSVFSPAQRFAAAVSTVAEAGWPVLDPPRRHRLGELTVAWDAVS